MSENIDWGERLEALLTGALAVWRLEGRITRDGPARCIIQSAEVALTVQRIADDGDPYWEVAAVDGALPALPYGGIQGMLRVVRATLGAEATGAPLVIGPAGDG